jgi:hypothetical protein
VVSLSLFLYLYLLPAYEGLQVLLAPPLSFLVMSFQLAPVFHIEFITAFRRQYPEIEHTIYNSIMTLVEIPFIGLQ